MISSIVRIRLIRRFFSSEALPPNSAIFNGEKSRITIIITLSSFHCLLLPHFSTCFCPTSSSCLTGPADLLSYQSVGGCDFYSYYYYCLEIISTTQFQPKSINCIDLTLNHEPRNTEHLFPNLVALSLYRDRRGIFF